MHPFEFIILLFSFVYALAFTHLMFAATRMIRHRRALVFSWPHALWMLSALLLLLANWISTWDFHTLEVLPMGLILLGFSFAALLYFICALVAPDFEDGESFDMKAFHAREGRTYIGAFLVLVLISAAENFAAGASFAIQNWAASNLLVILMVPPVAIALFVRRDWVQVLCPALVALSTLAFLFVFYGRLA